jgi:mannosyltransferase
MDPRGRVHAMVGATAPPRLRPRAVWGLVGSGRTVRLGRAQALVLALLALAAVLRFATLGSQSLWLDEAFTREVVGGSLKDVLLGVVDKEGSPPLFYLLTWVWTHLVGDTEAGLRSLSAICGLAFVWVAWLYGRRLAGTRAGLVLAAVAAIHPVLVWYSQEARAYSLAILAAGLGWLAFQRVLDEPTPRAVALWALAAAAAATTHYTTAFFSIVQGLWLLSRVPSVRGAVIRSGMALGLLGVALAPLAAVQASRGGRIEWILALPLDQRLGDAVRDFLVGPAPPTWHPAAFAAVLAGGASLLCIRRRDRARILLPAGLALAAVGLTLLVRMAGGDYVVGRNLLAGWLPLAAVPAAGVAALRRPALCVLAAVVLCAPLLAVTITHETDDSVQRTDWRAVARVIGRADQPRVIVSAGGFFAKPLTRYLTLSEVTPRRPPLVREIVAVQARTEAIARRCKDGALCGIEPSGPAPERVGRFRRVLDVPAADDRFRIVRYESSRPAAADWTTIAQLDLGRPAGQHTERYLQRP